MNTPLEGKSTVDEIRTRFANLGTGQTSTIDAALSMELITQAAFSTTRPMRRREQYAQARRDRTEL
jgi:hypothetical protein